MTLRGTKGRHVEAQGSYLPYFWIRARHPINYLSPGGKGDAVRAGWPGSLPPQEQETLSDQTLEYRITRR
jgi:hypothetical protein